MSEQVKISNFYTLFFLSLGEGMNHGILLTLNEKLNVEMSVYLMRNMAGDYSHHFDNNGNDYDRDWTGCNSFGDDCNNSEKVDLDNETESWRFA